MQKSLSIGDLSRATGVKPTTIRWYEAEGLLPEPGRTAGGHRAYAASHLQRLGFIRHARELGFAMPAVRALLDLAAEPEQDCGKAHAAAMSQIEAIDAKMRQLTALRAELSRVAEACQGGRVAECRIIETLADHTHGHCLGSGHGVIC
ncbi:helix-turn-helix domain-containing protein [Roseococcus sp. SDR]|uniref:MerR family transcriptional regulator n=1 Tax=Roseococcus sp. SDR TaxID=2835532 RepID=UPI001BCCE0C2|nr:helix-turn-helix domain-containing protein [Roseococcus sp. SDR]MBS7789350.1 helix-turn-helix domain-containing protein [Roseococcus sp. SDR]MBV1844664.1 helix-turn-helix domain-containing protein [Roseococcus sp. SDR]